jgi:peptidyl-prolyl cis-trans isomerase D
MFDTPEVRARILDSMIAQRLLLRQAVRGNLAITDEQLREVIASTPAFQDANRFSRERYEETLRREGYTPAMFEASLRRDLILQQYTSAISDSGIASRAASKQIAVSRAEQREASEYMISAEPFASKVKIEPQAVRLLRRDRSQFSFRAGRAETSRSAAGHAGAGADRPDEIKSCTSRTSASTERTRRAIS